MDFLLKKGACIDTVNKARCSDLHVAVNKQHLDGVKVLSKHRCNVNIQDSYGDSALHHAISKESLEIIDLIINVPEIDFTLKNKRGFNVLHHAALKGNNYATERLVVRSQQIVDGKTDDGFAALHLAALNGHFNVAETLLRLGHCEIEIRNNRKQTPLLLAVSQCHCALIELLISFGADVNVEDEDGDTGLHLALMKQNSKSEGNVTNSPAISNILSQLVSVSMEKNLALAVACYLAQEGGSLSRTNRKGKTPLELAATPVIQGLLQNYAELKTSAQAQSLVSVDDANDGQLSETKIPDVECMICCKFLSTVIFEPCGHRVACEACCRLMKKCIVCREVIVKKTASGGRILSKVRPASVELVRYLERKIRKIEEAHCCSICMERQRNVAFMCGHGACVTCAQTLETCHMCHKPITKTINLY